MLSKLVYAAAIGATVAHGHSIQQRDVRNYGSVNRDGGGHSGGGHSSGGGGGHSSGGGGGSSSSYGAPSQSSGYSAPSGGYSAPAPAGGYGAPESSYGAPESSYGAPSSSYGSDAGGSSYGGSSPSYGGYEEEGKFDISTILIPILALIGLSLLFPTFVSLSVGTGRKKRSLADDSASEASGLLDVVERVNDIYGSVMESEECMERIACEVGGLAADVGLNQVTRMAEPFAPKKYSKYMKQFSKGKDCHKIKCGNLF